MAKKKRRWNEVPTIQNFKSLKALRVFGIVRVSTDKQAKEGESLEHQKEVITNWVRAKASINAPQEWNLIELYVENEDKNGARRGRSGTSREGRNGLAKAIELAQAKLIDVVVVTKLDRIARNVRDYMDISSELNLSGTALVCLDLDIDTSTPDGQMIMRNHANLAQWQAERIAQYSIETTKRHARQGRPLGGPPLGYQAAREEGKSTLKPHPIYKKHVDLIDKLYLEHQSVNRVVKALHKKGYKTPRGKTYSIPQVSRILQNMRYVGKQEYNGEVLDGNWTALRSLADHEKIQRIMRGNRKTNHTADRVFNKYVYLLQGILKCPLCHSTMLPKPGTGRQGRYYPYYLCSKADKTNGIDCEQEYLPAETIDKGVVEFIRKLSLEPASIEEVVCGANKATSVRVGNLENDMSRVSDALKVTKDKVSNLVDILASKGVSQLASIKDKLETLDNEQKDLEVEAKRLEQEIRAEKAQAGAAHEQIQSLQLFNDIFLMNEKNPERIRSILPRFVRYVVIHITDKKKGTGRLDMGLFGRPFSGGQNSETWNDVLNELAERYNKSLNPSAKGKSLQNESRFADSPVNHISSTAEPVFCGQEDSIRPRVTNGVNDGDRTRDSQNHNLELYQLSYVHHEAEESGNYNQNKREWEART